MHADGGKWIKSGLENFAQRKMVMDGYHFEKSLKKLANLFPKKNVRQRIRKALEEDDRKRADEILQSLCIRSDKEEMEKVAAFGAYLMGHWDAIRRRVSEELPGSCTEGQVSHILSERFSNKSCEGKLDWGIFEKQDPNFDGASGTQILIHKAAQLRDLRLN